MERGVLEIIADRHKEWHYLTMAFGCNRDTAEDIVQEMYLRLHKVLQRGQNLMYNETEINHYYIIKTLKSIYIDKIRKEKNMIEVEFDREAYRIEIEDTANYDSVHDTIQNELNKLYWFDRKVFDMINAGEKIADLSRKTTIPYYTLYNTYKKVYNYLKEYL